MRYIHHLCLIMAWPLLVSACALLDEMASFDSAGVSERDPA